MSVQAGDQSATPVITEIAVETVDPVHDAIQKQMSAIQARDADQAFALTTNGFHEKYDTAKNFLSQMRFEFRPIYNHEQYTFLERQHINGSLIQKVEVTDRYGNDPVIVIYRLEPQDDGTWLIDSFSILDNDARAI